MGAFDAVYLKDLQWLWVAFYAIVLVLALLVVAQHLYYAINYKLTRANTAKLVGAVLVAGSAIASICSQAINPQGFTRGYPTPYDLISYTLPINALLCFLSICVAINTANWFWIGLAAVSPIFRGKEGWGWPSHLIVWVVTVYSVILAIYLAVVQVDQLGFDTYLYVSAGTILVLLIFSLVSGIFVLVTISNIDHADPKLLRNTAVQLVVVCAFELLAGVLLIIIGAVPSSAYTSVYQIWAITSPFAIVVQCFFLIMLLVQFRIAIWQLKEVALTRHNTNTGFNSSSARHTANSYNDDGAVSGSSMVDEQQQRGQSDSNKGGEVQLGVIVI